MPSTLIHMAIAKRYSELHSNRVLKYKDLEKGSIAPDFDKDFSRLLSASEKEITHYYISLNSNVVDFEKFKCDKNVNLANDYWKGYYLHLLADHFFYTAVFKQEYEQSIKDGIYLYDDYSVLTSKIIADYHLDLSGDYITDTVKQYLIAKNGKCKYLNYKKLLDFIEELAMKVS